MDKITLDKILDNRDVIFSGMEFRKNYDSVGAVYSIHIGENMAVISAHIDGIMPYIVDGDMADMAVYSRKTRKTRETRFHRDSYADAMALQWAEDNYFNTDGLEYGLPREYDNHFNNETSVSYKIGMTDIYPEAIA